MEKWQLEQMRSLPLELKVEKTRIRIREYYEELDGDVYISFSGGKDSTVLLDIARSLYPGIPAVFSDTGLEYPEIREFVKTIDNVIWVKPKKNFRQVIEEDGYPVISKNVSRFVRDLKNPTDKNEVTRNLRLTGMSGSGKFQPSMKLSNKWMFLVDAPFKLSEKCCNHIKKYGLDKYAKETGRSRITGILTDESMMRERVYLQQGGCNIFKSGNGDSISTPMAFWTEQDVLQYIVDNNLPISSIYGHIYTNNDGLLQCSGEARTGCMFCMFGVHMEPTPNRFQRMKLSHPSQYKFCMENLGMKEVLEYIGIPYE
jgi:3'-phosphoadenosine 5'-phosphosulfate sulfotransferase (PAPS reductase)/FAD synthetase